MIKAAQKSTLAELTYVNSVESSPFCLLDTVYIVWLTLKRFQKK